MPVRRKGGYREQRTPKKKNRKRQARKSNRESGDADKPVARLCTDEIECILFFLVPNDDQGPMALWLSSLVCQKWDRVYCEIWLKETEQHNTLYGWERLRMDWETRPQMIGESAEVLIFQENHALACMGLSQTVYKPSNTWGRVPVIGSYEWDHLDDYTVDCRRTPYVVPPELGLVSIDGSLDLSRAHVKEIPNTIGAMRIWGALDLSDNELSSLPMSLVDVSGLKRLILAGNDFQTIPPVVFELLRIGCMPRVDLRRNPLPAVVDEINDWADRNLGEVPYRNPVGSDCDTVAGGVLTLPPSDDLHRWMETDTRHIVFRTLEEYGHRRHRRVRVVIRGVEIDIKCTCVP